MCIIAVAFQLVSLFPSLLLCSFLNRTYRIIFCNESSIMSHICWSPLVVSTFLRVRLNVLTSLIKSYTIWPSCYLSEFFHFPLVFSSTQSYQTSCSWNKPSKILPQGLWICCPLSSISSFSFPYLRGAMCSSYRKSFIGHLPGLCIVNLPNLML